MSGSALVLQADARRLPLRDCSVNLVVTSPPYFGLRDYSDGGAHLAGQIGLEPTPAEFLAALWGVLHELWRVLADDGSLFVNLGDKRAGSGAPGTSSGFAKIGSPPDSRVQGARSGITGGYSKAAFGRPKSKMLLPHRFAIGAEDGLADPDGLGWIVRQEIVWDKPAGLPEPVRDRTRDSHEYFFHLTKRGSYYAAMDDLRVPHTGHAGSSDNAARSSSDGASHRALPRNEEQFNPLGRLPGSVWKVSAEPLSVPEHLGVEHFAAFPSEWPRRLITGFCPPAGVVLDPFGGTGTTAMAARALGRTGISCDLGADYSRLARWRVFDSDGAARVADRAARGQQGRLL